ncbi:MAG TPA: hypothetical protein VH765_09050 [Xanthobacteraceae bacterium]|jgi:hypothetical protein
MRQSILIGVALATLSATTVSADVRIRNDPGGIISQHMQVFARLRDSGERIVIDGHCYSSCTLVLGIVPPDRVCVTPRARLGFHAAWVPGGDGRPLPSPEGTATMWGVYPDVVRKWITNRGGLRRELVILSGRELTSMVRPCR